MNAARALHHLDARDRDPTCPRQGVLTTGIPALDALLPTGGWPRGALVEIIVPDEYCDALAPLLPVLAHLSREERWLGMLAPPYRSLASFVGNSAIDTSRLLQINQHPGRSGLWTLEQMLRSGTCSAVLAWPVCDTELIAKRLQKAAAIGNTLGFLFSLERHAKYNSRLDLRLRFEVTDTGRRMVSLLNGCGDQAGEPACLP